MQLKGGGGLLGLDWRIFFFLTHVGGGEEREKEKGKEREGGKKGGVRNHGNMLSQYQAVFHYDGRGSRRLP